MTGEHLFGYIEQVARDHARMLNTDVMAVRRAALGLSQQEAAARAGLTGRQRWHNIESGRNANVTLTTLARIAAALECDPRDLILSQSSSRRTRRSKR